MLVDTALGHISTFQANLSGAAFLQFVLVAVVAYNLLWFIYTSLISSLGKIPGPFLARISRVWEMKEAATGNLHETIIHLHQRHGKFMASCQ